MHHVQLIPSSLASYKAAQMICSAKPLAGLSLFFGQNFQIGFEQEQGQFVNSVLYIALATQRPCLRSSLVPESLCDLGQASPLFPTSITPYLKQVD